MQSLRVPPGRRALLWPFRRDPPFRRKQQDRSTRADPACSPPGLAQRLHVALGPVPLFFPRAPVSQQHVTMGPLRAHWLPPPRHAQHRSRAPHHAPPLPAPHRTRHNTPATHPLRCCLLHNGSRTTVHNHTRSHAPRCRPSGPISLIER